MYRQPETPSRGGFFRRRDAGPRWSAPQVRRRRYGIRRDVCRQTPSLWKTVAEARREHGVGSQGRARRRIERAACSEKRDAEREALPVRRASLRTNQGKIVPCGRAPSPVARPLPKDRGASGCGLAGVFRGPMLRSNADRNAPCRPKKPPRLNYLTSKNPRLIILTGLSGGAARSRYCARDGPDFPIATVASPISSIRKTL